jgi:hypothetical protein
MRKLLLLFTLLFSTVIFTSISYAEWTLVSKNYKSNQYLDFERIRKVDGYVYYWTLSEYLERTPLGHLSGKVYHQGDCKLFRRKILSDSYYEEPRAVGIPTNSSNKPDKEWSYPSPNSSDEVILNFVCALAIAL